MKNLRIKYLIATVTSALIAVTLAVGGLGYFSTQRAVELLENSTLRTANQQLALASMVHRMETNRSQLLQALQHNPDSKYAVMHDHPLANHFNNINSNTAALLAERDKLLDSLRRPETRAAVARWRQDSQEFGVELIGNAARALEGGDWDKAQEILIRQVNPSYLKGQQAYKALQDYMSTRNVHESEALHAELRSLNRLIVGAIAFAVLLAVAATLYLVAAITRPLGTAVDLARRVAGGDLSAQIVVDTRNEFGQLLGALRDMNTSLAGIVGEVRSGSDVIATASSQIAAGNMDLSSRTEQQASSIEETAASVEELTTTVRQNADNARQANGLAASASDVATRGGAVVREVVGTMGAINDSARKIVDIIAVIDGIAFQTNILALNAAVEAARAGEQGRGFAVVASEVRSLAQRSAGAAKEIKALITDSVEKVDSGSRLVNQAGTTMEEIVHSVRRVAAIMEEITAATSEQSAGIEQIHEAVSQMDQVTQQNAALVEEAAGAAQSLQDSAAGLVQRVSVFKLGHAVHERRPGVRPAAAYPKLERAATRAEWAAF
ncbi:methyl-accepting chemotaxis protein [Massilia litorea]|uniref:HAMP domain-containing protein n=1 Tax=Massilia litorea TaxID=2769491 RepID=A0A7L9U964_9BURK|nr:methyl-accepting chemotaxis protein [Massilia litorea]QOL51591.1 HAMP domain-containing protein [Massilia litorea]